MVDRAATGKTSCFFYLTDGSRTTNWTNSLYQTVNGLVENVEWGESLTIVACDFRGLNSFGARMRVASVWLAEETRFPENIPPVTVLKAMGFVIQFQKKENIYILLATKLLMT